jgi:hypothetical protein
MRKGSGSVFLVFCWSFWLPHWYLQTFLWKLYGRHHDVVGRYGISVSQMTMEQRFTKHTHKTMNRVTRTPVRTGGELMYSGRVSSSCSTSSTRRVNLVTNPVASREWGKDRKHLALFGYMKFLLLFNRNCLPYRSTWVHPRFLVGFVLLHL